MLYPYVYKHIPHKQPSDGTRVNPKAPHKHDALRRGHSPAQALPPGQAQHSSLFDSGIPYQQSLQVCSGLSLLTVQAPGQGCL